MDKQVESKVSQLEHKVKDFFASNLGRDSRSSRE